MLQTSEGNTSNFDMFKKMFAIWAMDDGPVFRIETELLHISHKNINSSTSIYHKAAEEWMKDEQSVNRGRIMWTKKRCSISLVIK